MKKKLLLGAALGALVSLVLLVTWGPNITYDEGFETGCRSIIAAGGTSTVLTANGGVVETRVLRGEEVAERIQEEAENDGVMDRAFLRRQLNADCTDRRTRILVWSQIAGMAFVLSLVGAMRTPTNAPGGERRPSDSTDPMPSEQ